MLDITQDRSKRRDPSRPKGRQLDDRALTEVRALLGARFGDGPRRRDLLIEYLHLVQDAYGHVSAAHIRALAEELRLAQVEVIAAERGLDAAFESGTIDRAVLDRLLMEAETVRAALRGVHLAAHLEVTPLLSEAQRERYAALRGYGDHAGHGGH